MNEWSQVPAEKRPETRFNAMNLYRWFHQHGGKEKSPLEKPYLTKDQMKARKKWCEFEKKMEEWGENFHCCFLDEKWFYTTSRRRKVKVLPPGSGEDAAAAVALLPPTTVSRRHVIKVSVSAPIDCCVCLFVSRTD